MIGYYVEKNIKCRRLWKTFGSKEQISDRVDQGSKSFAPSGT